MKPNGAAAAIKLIPEFNDHIPFPWITDEDERDEAEYRLFLRKVLPELIRVAQADERLLHSSVVGTWDIFAVIKCCDEGLELLWRAGSVAARERLVESLRSWWPRYLELRAQTKSVADQIIAKRAVHQ